MLRTVIPALAATAAVLGSAAPALASDARIIVSGLDLSRPAHAAILEARIEAAARDLCRDARRPGSRLPDRDFCRAQVRAEALRQLPGDSRAEYVQGRRQTAF